MRDQMKNFLFFVVAFFGLFGWGGTMGTASAQQSAAPVNQPNPQETQTAFIQKLTRAVSFRAAHLIFDYQKRPVIGVLIADFDNPSGEEIVIGDEIATAIRAALDKEKQFHVYGKEHPAGQSLKTSIASDPPWRVTSQRNFQQDLVKNYKAFPVDLVITGRVSPTPENQLKVTVNLIPFYEPINLVETESGRSDISTEQFLGPILSPQEISRALTVIRRPQVPKGRLVIVSLMVKEKGRSPEPDKNSSPVIASRILSEAVQDPGLKTKSKSDFTCWLDDKELTIITDWEGSKKKEYHDILSGFSADTIWFDNGIEEGPHSIFFSFSKIPPKNQYKTLSKSFSVKKGTTNYLFFTILSDTSAEPEVRVRYIIDPLNKALPF